MNPYENQPKRNRAPEKYKRAPTTARGYGTDHQRLRRRWEPDVAAGVVHCARGRECLRFPDTLIRPEEPWDLGHVDDDRSRYSGPEHAGCNRSAANRRRAKRHRRGSRPW